MATSLLLGRVLALYLVIMGFALLINHKTFAQFAKEVKKCKIALFAAASIDIILGLFITISHNIWTNDWRTIVTLLGWATLMEGLTILVFPEYSLKMVRLWKKPIYIYATAIMSIFFGTYMAILVF